MRKLCEVVWNVGFLNIVILQVAEMIRHIIDRYAQTIPAILEIPSKEHPYDASKDSILRRAKVRNYCLPSASVVMVFYCTACNAYAVLRWEFCPSVRLTCELWQNERGISPDFYTIQKVIYLSFSRKRTVGRGQPLLPEILLPPTPIGVKVTDFEPKIARSASAVRPSKKSSINTNGKSTMRFPMSLRWSSHVALSPPREVKNAKRPFFL